MNAEAKTLAARLAEWVVDFSYHPSRPGDTRAIVEAELRADFPEIDRLSAPVEGVGLSRYSFSIRGNHYGTPPDPNGEWVRHEDATAALAAKEAEIAATKEAGRALLHEATKAALEIEAERDALKAGLELAKQCHEVDKARRAALSPAQGGG